MSLSPRLESVDLLRGLVMVIMALDHVRAFFTDVQFSPTDLSQTSAALFFTRWITHFCAPVFFFLAGTGAFLSLARGRNRSGLSYYLFTRGLWLVFLELTVVSFAWTFNFGPPFLELAVIWALGWSMVILAGLVFLPLRAIAAIGILMIVTHNLLDGIHPEDFSEPDGTLGWPAWVFSILHELNPPVIYPLIPWIGAACARMDRSSRRVAGSQSFTVRSRLPEAQIRPSGATATAVTAPRWPRRTGSFDPSAASQSLSVPSQLAVRILRLSAENEAE